MRTSRRLSPRRAMLFLIGGVCYNFIEVLWRGYTHWSMFLLGGVCFRLIGHIGRVAANRCLLTRSALCATAVTACEFCCGCVVNRWWHLSVWDYSGRPLNLLGQVCLLYTVLWGLLSIPAMPLYRALEGALRRPCTAFPARRTRKAALSPFAM